MVNVAKTGPWSVDFLWGVSLWVLALVLLSAGFGFMLRVYKNASRYDKAPALAGTIGVGIIFTIVAVAGAGGLYPWNAEYHQYRQVTGQVQNVTSKILPDGDSVDQRFVLDFGAHIYYGCNDSRCSAIKPGDHVTLRCIREHESNSVDGYGCRFISNNGQREP